MEENNKLLANFLGLELEEEQDRLFIQGLGTQLIEDTFNKKWDWLMQVVEKIESLGFFVSIKKNWCKITHNDGSTLFLRWEEDTNKIEAVYNACVEFVEWWNKENN